MRWGGLLDLVYPRSCAGCGGDVDGGSDHLCWDCLAKVTYVQPPYCAVCGDPVDGRIDDAFTCYVCSSARPHFDLARSAVRYTGVLQNALRAFKYREALWMRTDLARVMEACVAAHYDPDRIDLVTFVPLYPARQRERGYNQSELLARALARRLRKPLKRCLARIRPTRTQTNLTAPARATNVKDAFRPRRARGFAGRRVLLVDDVMTTGATVNECARMLKRGGAEQVYVVTVARG